MGEAVRVLSAYLYMGEVVRVLLVEQMHSLGQAKLDNNLKHPLTRHMQLNQAVYSKRGQALSKGLKRC